MTELSKTNTQEPDSLPDGFKMTELGPLPEGWDVVRLGEVGDISAGGSAPQGSQYFGGIHPFVRVQHLDEDGYEVRRYDLITDEAVRKYRLRLFPPGTIVFPKSGASIRLEKRAILTRPSYLVSHLCAVIPKEEQVDGTFLFFALKSIPLAAKKAEGYPTLSLAEIKRTAIPFPPLPEQRAIAYVLRAVQQAKEATEGVIAALRELRKSLMRHLFTYGPVPLAQADQVPMQETEIGPLPAHWRVVRLGDLKKQKVLWLKNGFPQGKFNEQGYGIPHLRPFNVTDDGRISLSQIKYVAPSSDDRYWLSKGDILFNNTNSEELVGKVAYFNLDGKYTLSNHMTIIRVQNPKKLNNIWLAYWLLHLWQRKHIQALARRHVNQASISLARLDTIPIPLPPLSEQQEIARILQAVDRKIEAEERRKQALEALFKTLLHDLMTARRRLPGEFIARFAEETCHE
ncbi:restriction endonuclease subunit S [Thermus sp.]|jgi:type I restriction enzyme S subunit|uniref:restriction endonuclease subunit S n=1 Tax=Thermus sp. TaxID=275 RepID=UPI0032208679